ncbi:hypothetical protein YC2023_032819 [Brassica napus]
MMMNDEMIGGRDRMMRGGSDKMMNAMIRENEDEFSRECVFSGKFVRRKRYFALIPFQ